MSKPKYRSLCCNRKLISPKAEVVVCTACGNVCTKIREVWLSGGITQILSAELLPGLLIDERQLQAEREQEKQRRLGWYKRDN